MREARRNQVPVIFVATEHDQATDSEAWLSRYGKNFDRVKTNLSCRKGTWGTAFYVVEPEKEEIVVIKHKYSAFVGTDLDNLLQSLGIQSLLFTGVATNICVESTLRDGLHHDYLVTLVDDCCATYDMTDHISTIRNVENRFGMVATSEEITGFWNKR
ncbi:cysteine hydrolase family protein [Cohnella kolymensis]|uniref:cysteine hydrolase family protein n=1 Tax=Cohnella kolymensis TaxID=1590652 RepID=UPI001F25095A|nr:cysteine hydrolase [Cohnella kolymensis]